VSFLAAWNWEAMSEGDCYGLVFEKGGWMGWDVYGLWRGEGRTGPPSRVVAVAVKEDEGCGIGMLFNIIVPSGGVSSVGSWHYRKEVST
jgi:hypothetical protein